MRRVVAVLAFSIVLLGAGWAQASLTTVKVQPGEYVELAAGSHQYAMYGETGGEFEMTVYGGDKTTKIGSFYTFCADPTTFMNYNTLYYVKDVSDSDALGYEISDYGKWIYYEYAKNDNGAVVSSYIPGHLSPGFTNEVAGAIQEGIWQELTKTVNGVVSVDWPTGWDHAAYNTVSFAENWANNYASGDNADFQRDKGAIMIGELTLNLADVQNQMVFTMVSPAGEGAVPEPSTMIVWSLLGVASWLGTMVWRRRAV